MAGRKKPVIYIVSDGRGETAAIVVKAAVVQFEGAKHRIVKRAGVKTPEAVEAVVSKAAETRSIIFYTLVGEDTRATMEEATKKLLVPTVDLLGPAFSALRDLFQRKPGSTPGLLVASDREYYNRLDAIDYTLHHDDGRRPHELLKADVVLVGVSRAAKSSTCFLLAYRGVRAANVPLIPGMKPIPQLLKVDPDKVIGLRINVPRLLTVREARAMALRMPPHDPYLDKRTVAKEVLQANEMMDIHGWRSFDVSYLAVEEIAREVTQMIGLKPHNY